VSDLLQRIEEFIGREGLLKRNQRVVVAVSGGLDSMVLLEILRQLAGKYAWRPTVAHFNHKLRGPSSAADERLVRLVARRFRLPCVVGAAEVRRIAADQGVSVEMAARAARHEFLAHVARERNARRIALAHHADDQVELFLLRLLRGAGPQGLAGMNSSSPSPADPRMACVRPLLGCSKSELLEFARRHRVRFREDASNRSPEFLRNRVRHELIPLLKTYQPALDEVILRDMEILRSESELIEQLARDWVKTPARAFREESIAVQRRVLQRRLIELGVSPDFKTVEQLRRYPRRPAALCSDVVLRHDGKGRLSRESCRPVFRASFSELQFVTGQGRGTFEGLEWDWGMRRVQGGRMPKFCPGCEWFDADKVGPTATLRHWRTGDRFQPIGLKSPVKLQDLFVNAKVPRGERHLRVVATTNEGEIWWVEGLRISERFKLTPQTKRQLKWSWRRGMEGQQTPVQGGRRAVDSR
jgi:tRNA(Ile)-lysidine synthase